MSEIVQAPGTVVPPGHTAWACPTCRGPVSTSWLFCERCGTDFRRSRPHRLAVPIPLQADDAVGPALAQGSGATPHAPSGPVPPVPTAPAALISAPVGRLGQASGFAAAPGETWLDRLPGPLRPGGASGDHRALLQVLGAVLAVLMLLGAVLLQLQTRSDLHRTQEQLARTSSQLTSARNELAVSESQLAASRDSLSAQTTKLTDAQSDLEDANDRLNLQTDQIDDLKTCLAGVQNSYGYFLDYDYDSAMAELSAVETACSAAYALF